MVWTTPIDYVGGDPLTEANLDAMQDNLRALKDPPSANYELNEGADYTTTSVSFVDVDATVGKLNLTIVTNGGDVLVHFHGNVNHTNAAAQVYLNVDVDGSPEAANDGIICVRTNTTGTSGFKAIAFTLLITGLAAGSHTFKLQWKASAGATATLAAGAGTANIDLHPQFWVREVS